jgi:hypothetical protein
MSDKQFALDYAEYDRIDQYATKHQQKYGIPDYGEVNWVGKEVPWSKHVDIITKGVWGEEPKLKSTTIPKGKDKNDVTESERMAITNNWQ